MVRLLSLAFAVVAFSTGTAYDESPRPAAVPTGDSAHSRLPVGKWRVEFANSVIEKVDVGNGGESTVEEPMRRCVGMAETKDATVVFHYGDDRIERWTPVGKRYVVEHWFPTSRLPVATPVVGIAERARD